MADATDKRLPPRRAEQRKATSSTHPSPATPPEADSALNHGKDEVGLVDPSQQKVAVVLPQVVTYSPRRHTREHETHIQHLIAATHVPRKVPPYEPL